MKLERQEKNSLLKAAKKVYFAYIGLDFFKLRSFTTQQGQQVTLYDLCQQAIRTKEFQQNIVLDKLHYQLTLIPAADNSYTVHCSRIVGAPSSVFVKAIANYSSGEALGLLIKQQFLVQANDDGQLLVFNVLDKRHTIGGSGTIDLERSHLLSLKHLIDKIEADEDSSNFLVALAAGVDATYVHALWMLVLSLSGNNGIFAVPDASIESFTNDLKKLLPERFVHSMSVLREQGSSPQAHLALKSLSKPDATGQIIIGSSEYLLDEHYADLQAALPQHTFLAFAEQHELMRMERRRIRLLELAKQKVSLFLTTPSNQEIYPSSAELGARVAEDIIAWIYDHLDDDETINPDHLKRTVLKFIVHALREINNKNSHQMKLSRVQLSQIVHEAMQGLDKETAHLNKPYRLSFFSSALNQVLNFISDCYFTVKRIPAALRIYYHSWFGKRENNSQNSSTERHADDVYIKMLQGTSFQKSSAGHSTFLEFNNWLEQKNKGLSTHLKKNSADYFKQETLKTYVTHQKKFIEPFLLHCVVDTKRKQVAEAFAACTQSTSFFHAHLPLLQRLFSERAPKLALFQEEVLFLLQQIPGLHGLRTDDIVYYPAKRAELDALFSQALMLTAAQSKELQEAASVRLALYVQNEFSKYFTLFVTYPDAVLLQKELAKDQNALLFAQHCLKKIRLGTECSPQFLFQELKTFFKVNEMKQLDEQMASVQTELSRIKEQINTNLIACLDVVHIDKMVHIISEHLAPVLVNLYPLEVRAHLFSAASDKVKIKKILMDQGNQLKTWGDLSSHALAELIFSQLVEERLPASLDLTQQNRNTKTFITQQVQTIMAQGLIPLFAGKLLAPSSWSLSFNYLGDKAIADFLQTENFFNSISLMLPYDEWLKLKKEARNDYSALIKIARHLINKRAEGALEYPSPEELLSLFDQYLNVHYVRVEERSPKIKDDLINLIKTITDKPDEHLSMTLKNQIIDLGFGQIIPLLLSFVKEDGKKQQILNLVTDRDAVYQFIRTNTDTFITLANSEEQELKQNSLALINQLLPETKQCLLTELHSPMLHIQDIRKQISLEVQKKIVISLCASELFRDALKQSFNHEDYQLVLSELSSDKNILELIEELTKESDKPLDKDMVFQALKAKNSKLRDIQPLHLRQHEFNGFIAQLSAHRSTYLDQDKVTVLVADSLVPVLFHKNYISTLDKTLGFLDEKDLIVLFSAMGKSDPEKEGRQVLRFISLLKNRNKTALVDEFMRTSQEGTDFDPHQIPVYPMLANIEELMNEVLDCHCYYNNHSRTGSSNGIAPKIRAHISTKLAALSVAANDSFYSHGLADGLSSGEQVKAEANQHKVTILLRVKNHILRPLWWNTKVSNLTHSLVTGVSTIASGCVSGGYAFINISKSWLNWISQGTYFKLSEKNPDSADFNDTAFEFTNIINKLTPMMKEQVQHEQCPEDVLVSLEEFISERSPRLGFFSGHLGRVKVEDVEAASSSNKVRSL